MLMGKNDLEFKFYLGEAIAKIIYGLFSEVKYGTPCLAKPVVLKDVIFFFFFNAIMRS